MLAKAYVQDKEGIVADRLLMADDSWVSDLAEIRAATALFYGGRDTWVDRDDARWYQRHIARAVLHEVPDSGHLVLASAWEGILDHVAPARGHIAQQNRDRPPAHLPDLRPGNER